MLSAFLSSFGIALLSEIADKTQLVILGLALKLKSPFRVFLGALLAHAAMDGLAVALGSWLGFSLPAGQVGLFVGVVFIGLGTWEVAKAWRASRKKEVVTNGSPFLLSFFLILASEFGDKSQIAAGLLAAEFRTPIAVFLGFVLGLAVTIAATVFFGVMLAKRLPRKTVKIIIGALFIIFGVVSLVLVKV